MSKYGLTVPPHHQLLRCKRGAHKQKIVIEEPADNVFSKASYQWWLHENESGAYTGMNDELHLNEMLEALQALDLGNETKIRINVVKSVLEDLCGPVGRRGYKRNNLQILDILDNCVGRNVKADGRELK